MLDLKKGEKSEMDQHETFYFNQSTTMKPMDNEPASAVSYSQAFFQAELWVN